MKQSTIKQIIVFSLFIALIVLLRYLNVGRHITLAAIQQHATYLKGLVNAHYPLSVAGYIVLYLLVMAFSIPVAAVMTITGGFLFGSVRGALFANFGATLGSIVAFLMVRYAFRSLMRERYGNRLKAFNKEFDQHGYLYMLTIRLVIVFPPFVGNVLAGLANVPLWTFAWTTLLGMMPGAFVYAFAGQQLHTLTSVRSILSANILLAVGLLVLLSLIPILFRIIRKPGKK